MTERQTFLRHYYPEAVMFKNDDLTKLLAYFHGRADFNAPAFLTLIDDTNEEVALRILARFWGTLKESRTALRESLKLRDHELARKVCHKVYGSAELLGFRRFGQESKELSDGLKTVTQIDGHFDGLQGYLVACEKLSEDISFSCPNLARYDE